MDKIFDEAEPMPPLSGHSMTGVQFSEQYFGDFIVVFQNQDTGLSTLKIESCKTNVVLIGLPDLKFFSGLFGFVFRCIMLEFLQIAIQAFELTLVFLMIPAGQNMLRIPFGTHLYQGMYRVIKQVNIGGEMHVRF